MYNQKNHYNLATKNIMHYLHILITVSNSHSQDPFSFCEWKITDFTYTQSSLSYLGL